MPRPRAAQSSNAQFFVTAKGAPESLNSFLDGFVATGGAESQAEQENANAIEVQLKLLNKASEVTKQKALAELTSLVSTAAESTVTRFTSVLCEAIIRHAHFNNPLVRASVFALLKALVGRGKEVKKAMVSNLRTLSGPWVMAMNDMEGAVRREASSAFEAAFAADKRLSMLSLYRDAIMTALTETIDSAVTQGGAARPIQDDALDPRANTLYSALRGMGYMAKHVSASQAAALSFICESPAFRAVMPLRSQERGYLAAKTPLVRAAALALLRDVASVCPFTTKLHQTVSLAVQGAIRDTNNEVTARCWELLLVWCRTGPSEVIHHAQPGFLDDVIDCFMECDRSADQANIIFPCLLPLLTQLSKDARCSGVLDEFAGALVEKTRMVGEAPNATAKELETVLTALMEVWELQCVRKKGTDGQGDCGELFTVALFNLCEITEAAAKRRRFVGTCARIVAGSLLRTSTRSEAVFSECMSILCAQAGAAFRVLPEQPSPSLVQSFHVIQASVMGQLFGQATAPASSHARSVPLARTYVDAHVRERLAEGDLNSLTILVEASHGRYVPPADLANQAVQQLAAVITASSKPLAEETEGNQEAPSSPTTSTALDSDTESHALTQTLISYALTWECADRTPLLSASSITEETGIRDTVRQHLLRDPQKAYELLLESCASADFDTIRDCLDHRGKGTSSASDSLTEEQQRELLDAIVRSLETTLRSVRGADLDGSVDGDDSESDDVDQKTNVRRTHGAQGAEDRNGDEEADVEEAKDGGSSSHEGDHSDGESDEAESQGADNDGNAAVEVLYCAANWCELLAAGAALSRVIGLTKPVLVARLQETMWLCVAAVAPCLHPEHYAAVKALRVVLPDSEDDVVASALDSKTHFLNATNFDLLVNNVSRLFAGYEVAQGELDECAERMLSDLVDMELPEPLQATQQLQQVVPFASAATLRDFATRDTTWEAFVMEPRESLEASRQQTALSLFDGYYPLSRIELSMFAVVRTGQLLRLLDTVGIDDGDAALFVHLLEAAAAREALSTSMCHILFAKLLPRAFTCFDKAEEAVALVNRLVTRRGTSSAVVEVSPLLCTLAASVRDIARELPENKEAREPARLAFLLNARRVVSAVTAAAVDALFTSTGAAGVTKPVATLFTSFYALMDETANVVKDNILAQLPAEKEALVIEACQMLPSWDTTTAKLALVVHRHLGKMPQVAPSTVKSLIEYAQRQNPMECLELLAELSCTRILDMSAFSDLVHALVNALSRCHTLQHLPTNGRLQQANPNRPLPPTSLETLRRTVLAASLARQGVVIHSRMDDALRSTVNLVVFDALCEAVLRLRTAQGIETELLAKIIASTTAYMGSLLTSDVQVLRASEASTSKIAAVLAYAYAWLYAAPIANLEAIGMDVVEGVVRSVCLLANLTLMRAPVASSGLLASTRQTISKIALKPLRDEFSSAEPLKLAQLRRQNSLIQRTHKQKILLFPYILSWCIYLTSPTSAEDVEAGLGTVAGNRERRQQVYHLLDLLAALLFAEKFKQARRVEDTFIGDAVEASHGHGVVADNGGAEASCQVGVTGFEVVALTRADAAQPMLQLARGAAAAIQLLISSAVLPVVKSWLETLERKVQALLVTFVEQFLSPPLISQNIMGVLLHGNGGTGPSFTLGDNLTVTVNESARTVDLVYEMEDAKAAVQIVIPSAFPLRQHVVRFTSGRDSGVAVDKWRGVMLKMTAELFGGSADIWGCIELFKQNLDAHFAGQEPCPICFAVVNAINHKLPEMRCSVCHNCAFHSNCLSTWWASGGQTVCPLCRSPWVSE